MKLLLIEDSRDITLALSRALAGSYIVDVASDGLTGLEKAQSGEHAIIVLDLNLPGMSGLELCQRLREQACTTPILILTAEPKVLTKISLLDAGADDYLTKPFSLGELKVRMRALYRRSNGRSPRQNQLLVDDLKLDCDKHTVERAGQPICLRRKEFALLECLMQNAGSVVTRASLCSHAWRDNEDPWANTIDVHIKYLRDKIDRPFGSALIQTVHGLGYKLETSALGVALAERN